MNKTIKTVILAVVIVACLAFVVRRLLSGGSGAGADSPAAVVAARDFYCLKCKKHVTAEMLEGQYTQLMMMGTNASSKSKCPECSESAAVAAINCPSCKEWVPSPGSGSGPGNKRGPVCPKCKKPITLPSPGGASPAAAK